MYLATFLILILPSLSFIFLGLYNMGICSGKFYVLLATRVVRYADSPTASKTRKKQGFGRMLCRLKYISIDILITSIIIFN
jgi:hypothetical protein